MLTPETYVRCNVLDSNSAVWSLRTINGDAIVVTDDPYQIKTESNILVIEMINLFSFDLLPVMKRDRSFLEKFKKVIIYNVHECPVKMIDQSPNESAMLQPVYEFLATYHREFSPTVLKYYDHDIDTDSSFYRWCRLMKIKSPPFKAAFGQRAHLANLLLSFVIEENNFNKENFKEEWKKHIRGRTSDKLFWSFNRHKRWGRILTFYLLWKNNLLPHGLVSMHVNKFNRRVSKVLGVDIQDKELERINQILPKEVDKVETVTVRSKYLPTMVPDEILGIPIAVATETNFFETNLAFTEKLLKPILCKQILLPAAVYNICHTLTDKYGFIFSSATYEIDRIKDPIKRAEKLIELLIRLKNDEDYLREQLSEVEKNYDKNLDILYSFVNDSENELIARFIRELDE